MKRIFMIGAALFLLQTAMSQAVLKPGDAGSKVHFTIKNFGLSVGGDFKGLKGAIKFDPAHAANAVVEVTVDANTIDTDNKTRDGHLQKEEYFNVEKYQTLQFKSTKVSGGPGAYTMEGTLTIKGVSKPVSFPFQAVAQGGGYLFTGEFEINRRDFGVGGSSAVMSDKLKVSLSILAK